MQKQMLDDSEDVQSERPSCFPKNRKHPLPFFKSPIFKNSLKFAITALFFLLVNRSLNQSDFKLILGRIDFFPLLIALLLSVLGFYFQIVRWQDILRSQALPYGINVAARTMLIGFFLGFLTPGRIGELFRGVSICPKRKTISVLAVATERYFAVFLTVIFGVFSVIAQFFFYKISVSVFFFSFLIIAFVLFSFAGTILKYLNAKFRNVSFLKSVFSSVQPFLPGLDELSLKRLILFSTLAHLCLIFQTAILLEMFGSAEFFKNCIIAAEAYAFMLFLPFFVANIGLREFSFSMFLSKLEAVSEIRPEIGAVAFGVSTLILFMNIILPAIFGLLWMLLGRKEPENYFKDDSIQ